MDFRSKANMSWCELWWCTAVTQRSLGCRRFLKHLRAPEQNVLPIYMWYPLPHPSSPRYYPTAAAVSCSFQQSRRKTCRHDLQFPFILIQKLPVWSFCLLSTRSPDLLYFYILVLWHHLNAVLVEPLGRSCTNACSIAGPLFRKRNFRSNFPWNKM